MWVENLIPLISPIVEFWAGFHQSWWDGFNFIFFLDICWKVIQLWALLLVLIVIQLNLISSWFCFSFFHYHILKLQIVFYFASPVMLLSAFNHLYRFFTIAPLILNYLYNMLLRHIIVGILNRQLKLAWMNWRQDNL